MENPAREVKAGRENTATVSSVGAATGETAPVWAETEAVETKKRATMKVNINVLWKANRRSHGWRWLITMKYIFTEEKCKCGYVEIHWQLGSQTDANFEQFLPIILNVKHNRVLHA